jgi:iron only hydrogenase large subunit-like protein
MGEKKSKLKFPLKGKYVALLAPSFVVDFSYPKIICQLRNLGFDKVIELTFGAKMVNREYHKQLKNSKKRIITSVCPGIVRIIQTKYPQYVSQLAKVLSPMIATAKVSKKEFPNHKIIFISPCDFKKNEVEQSKDIDFVIDFKELKALIKKFKVSSKNENKSFDKFYNDYTKIYPVAGGLSKTAHLNGVLKKEEIKVIDGISVVEKFLNNPDKGIRFLDFNFCKGGCVGGPCINSKAPLLIRKLKVLRYRKKARKEDIPEEKKGLIFRGKGINFLRKF